MLEWVYFPFVFSWYLYVFLYGDSQNYCPSVSVNVNIPYFSLLNWPQTSTVCILYVLYNFVLYTMKSGQDFLDNSMTHLACRFLIYRSLFVMSLMHRDCIYIYIYIYLTQLHSYNNTLSTKNIKLLRLEKSLLGVICKEFDAPWRCRVLFKPYD